LNTGISRSTGSTPTYREHDCQDKRNHRCHLVSF
jgi:hypothetical protein